ncbi:hypothetical protein M422DRAFT_233953 [Sphaerobolus stellatus SS14]|uniref:Uncharacterized protein n=1 Tax=Sphaerobolus stellatus (strain SS14) TaxID=990650 RepID=A0A0C9UU12_SPHS4|nr:hypothetical protein M422DRAFT_233953 [Sphaerobolus stellatus SS14]
MMSSSPLLNRKWTLDFLSMDHSRLIQNKARTALIILNQLIDEELLLKRLWDSSAWHACADGGANRLYDLCGNEERRSQLTTASYRYLPDLIKGDFDSIWPEVKEYYRKKGVDVIQDNHQDYTDLQKCFASLGEIESRGGEQYTVLISGGFTGRLDQTIHTSSVFHKLRVSRPRLFAITNENVGWVLDHGEHTIHVDMSSLGPTCGLLPVGVDETILSTKGLRWNLSRSTKSTKESNNGRNVSENIQHESREAWRLVIL